MTQSLYLTKKARASHDLQKTIWNCRSGHMICKKPSEIVDQLVIRWTSKLRSIFYSHLGWQPYSWSRSEEAHAFYGGDFFVPYICIGCRYLSFASRYTLKKSFPGADWTWPNTFQIWKTRKRHFFSSLL